MNKELEEAAEKYSEEAKRTQLEENFAFIDFINGAKWQEERMYSEEDMLKCWNAAYIDALAIDEETYKPLFFADFIEQLKNQTR